MPKVKDDFERTQVSEHKMVIIKDNEVYRHLRFQRSDTSDKCFDVITWPYHLCYTGDMGTYVFGFGSYDMFDVLREDRRTKDYLLNILLAVDKECWEYESTKLNYYFVWCVNAIPWAIAQYNAVGV